MKLSESTLKAILAKLALTREDEIGCDTCFQEVDRFVEMLLAGESPDSVMPLVQHHLEICGNCHEEFDALISAIRAAENE